MPRKTQTTSPRKQNSMDEIGRGKLLRHRDLFARLDPSLFTRTIITVRVDQLTHSPIGQLRSTNAAHVRVLTDSIYSQGWNESAGHISVVKNTSLVEKVEKLRPSSMFEGLEQHVIPSKDGELPALIVCDGDHRVEALNAAFSRACSKKDVRKRQAFAYVPVMLWSRTDNRDVSSLEMLQIGARCNFAIEVSRKMDFLDTISLCIGVANRAEQHLRNVNLVPKTATLNNNALSIVLSQSGILSSDSARAAEKFARLVNTLRTEAEVYSEFCRLWAADRANNRQIMSMNLFRLAAFSNFDRSCRIFVLRALHKMAASRPKLTGIKEGGEDGRFFDAAAALLDCIRNMWRANELLDYKGPSFDATDASTVIPREVWDAPAANAPAATVATVFVDVAGAFDVAARDDGHKQAVTNSCQALREGVRGVVDETDDAQGSRHSSEAVAVEEEVVQDTASEEIRRGHVESSTLAARAEQHPIVPRAPPARIQPALEPVRAEPARAAEATIDAASSPHSVGSASSGRTLSDSVHTAADSRAPAAPTTIVVEDDTDEITPGRAQPPRQTRNDVPVAPAPFLRKRPVTTDTALDAATDERSKGRRLEPTTPSLDNNDVPAGKPPGAKDDNPSYTIVLAEAVATVEKQKDLDGNKKDLLIRGLEQKSWLDGVSCSPSTMNGARDGEVSTVLHIPSWLHALGVPATHRSHVLLSKRDLDVTHWSVVVHALVAAIESLPAARLRLELSRLRCLSMDSHEWSSWLCTLQQQHWFEIVDGAPHLCFEWLSACRTTLVHTGVVVFSRMLMRASEAAGSSQDWQKAAYKGMMPAALEGVDALDKEAVREMFLFCNVQRDAFPSSSFFNETRPNDASRAWWLEASGRLALTALEQEADPRIVWAKALLEVRVCQLFSLMAMDECFNVDFHIPAGGSMFFALSTHGAPEPIHTTIAAQKRNESVEVPLFEVFFTGPDAVIMLVWDYSHRLLLHQGGLQTASELAKLPSRRVLIPSYSVLVVNGNALHALAGVSDYTTEERAAWTLRRPIVGYIPMLGQARENKAYYGERRDGKPHSYSPCTLVCEAVGRA